MVYQITIRKDLQNELFHYVDKIPKQITVSTLNITDGLLKKGDYYIPVEHILFIEEV